MTDPISARWNLPLSCASPRFAVVWFPFSRRQAYSQGLCHRGFLSPDGIQAQHV